MAALSSKHATGLAQSLPSNALRAVRNAGSKPALAANFCDEQGIDGYRKDGPSAVANFHSLQEGDDDDRIRVQLEVSGMVSYFIQQVAKLRGKGSAE
jgi:hypothetical protein